MEWNMNINMEYESGNFDRVSKSNNLETFYVMKENMGKKEISYFLLSSILLINFLHYAIC